MYFQKYNTKFLQISDSLPSVDLTRALSIKKENKTIIIDYGFKEIMWFFKSTEMATTVLFCLKLGYNQEPMLMAILNECKEFIHVSDELRADLKRTITANVKYLEYETKRAKKHIKLLQEQGEGIDSHPNNDYHRMNTEKLVKETEKYLELIDWTAEIFKENNHISDSK